MNSFRQEFATQSIIRKDKKKKEKKRAIKETQYHQFSNFYTQNDTKQIHICNPIKNTTKPNLSI